MLCALLIELSACNRAQTQIATPTPQPGTNIGDGGLISEQPCGPPCLLGVKPGVSTADDVLVNLRSAGFGSLCQREGPGIGCPAIPIFFFFGEDENTIKYINFSPANITLSNVIEKYGPPTRWYVSSPIDDSGDTIASVTMELFYDEIFTIIQLEYQEGSWVPYKATPESKVESVIYRASIWDEGLYPGSSWHGYGKYRNQ